jgi:hypothetical protein
MMSIQESVMQVQAIMPNLKHLHICLSVEEDVSFIMEKMVSLESLNGIRVETNSDVEDHSSKNESSAHSSPVK